MRIALCSLLVALCLVFQLPFARADNAYLYLTRTNLLSKEQKLIFAKTHRLDKPIDEETHRRFWTLFSDEDRRAWIEAEQGGRSRADGILLYDRIETAFWQSIFETLKNGRTTKLPILGTLWATAPVNRYDEDDRWANYLDWQDRMLDLNWLRNSKSMARYPLHAFARMNEARFTVRQMEALLHSEWNERVENWPYPPMNLDLTWTHPWQVNRAVLCEADCKHWSLRPSPSERYPFAIYFMAELPDDFDPLESKDYRAGMNFMTDLLALFEVLEQQRRDADWQGHRSVTFASTIASQGNAPLYTISRLVFDPRSSGLLVFAAWSSISLDDAWRQFDVMAGAVTLH